MIFTNTQLRGPKPHLFLHHGQWWLMRPWQNEADVVYLCFKQWYYVDIFTLPAHNKRR